MRKEPGGLTFAAPYSSVAGVLNREHKFH